MYSHLVNRLRIYEQQRAYMLIFVVFFCGVCIFFSASYWLSALMGTIAFAQAYLAGSAIYHPRKKLIDLIIIGSSALVPVAFAPFLGPGSPLWLFSIVHVFQAIYLIDNRNQRIGMIVFAIICGVLTGFIQGHPIPYIAGRAMIMIAFGVFSVQTIRILLSSQRSLENQIKDKLNVTDELFKAKAFQRQVLDSTNYAIIATDLNGIIIEFNKGAEQMLEYGADEVLGKHTPEIFHLQEELIQRTRDINDRYNARILPGFITLIYKNRIGLANTSEWSYKTKSGKIIRVVLNLNILKNVMGQTIGYLGIANDITNKKLSEEKQHTAETIIANSPSVLFKWMPNETWTVIYVSANVMQVLGYTSIEFTGNRTSYGRLIHEDDMASIIENTNRAIDAHEEKLHLEYRLKHREGHYIWVEERTYINRDENDRIEFYEGIITDITQRKLAEEKLKESELRYELAARGTAAGIWDWLDVHSSEQWWSSKFYELLGYVPNEIPASIESFRAIVHPDDGEKTRELLNKHFNENIPFLIEYRFKTKSGNYKWFLGSGQVYRDADGNPKRMVGSIIDIDYKKQNEELLSRNEERFRLLVESARDIFYNTDSSGKFTYANEVAESITGYSIEEILNMHYIDLIREDYRDKAIQFYNDQIRLAKALTYFEFPVRTKNNEEKWIGQNVQMIYIDGIFNGIQAVARDITALKKAQQQVTEYMANLERTNKELDQFAYVVSHDLKAPVRAIANLTEWIREELEPHLTSDTIMNFDLLKRRVFRMEQFINGVLQYSRAGRRSIKMEKVDIRQLVKDIIELQGIPPHVIINTHIDDIRCSTDVISLEQVITNLVNNAIKHNDKHNPQVEITCRKEGKNLVFSVADNGPGIAKQYHEKIFRMFQTLEARDNNENTGIGLTIVKKILDERGGRISLKSTPGQGSIFQFQWPV